MNQIENIDEKKQIFEKIRFAFFDTYKVAGMGEPWSMEIEKTLGFLREEGIGAILTLTETNNYEQNYRAAGFLHHHEPIDDCLPPKSIESMCRAVSFIESCLDKGIGVAIHCLEGRGRTGTVLAGWLGKKESLDAAAAIDRVYKGRFHTVITPSQRDFLAEYLSEKK